MLICPVRDCRLPLDPADRRLLCPRGHSFDAARSGYVNLLQPQDRRSRQPGDAAAAVAARRRLHDRGLSAPLLAAIAQLLQPAPTATILDAGCGDGFYLDGITRLSGASGIGIDISIPAIDSAARRYPHCQWLVANADRSIPCAAASLSAVLSITARRNPAEFHRVLEPAGRLLLALPAPDDLLELRGSGRDRVPAALAEFDPYFTCATKNRATATADLDENAIHDLFLSIYRPSASALPTARRVTFSLDLLLFNRRESPLDTQS